MGCCGSRLVNDPDEFDDVGDIPHVHAEDADVAVKLSIDVDQSTKAVSIVGASSDFHLKYTLGDVIGKGGFSVVHKAVLKASGVEYAVKCIQRDKLDGDDLARMAAEVNALAQLKHPNILHLFDFFAEEHFYYIVTEYLQGGELFQRLIEKTYYTQQDAKNVVRTLLETIQYCHTKGIAHRDLKPENILLTSMYDDASVKLADFGLATLHHNRSSMVTRCGSPLYLAPEILHLDTPYGKECDIWSIGVITYMLLSGCPPFYDENVGQLYSKIKCGQFEFEPAYYWSHVSHDAKHLISCMLQGHRRATARACMVPTRYSTGRRRSWRWQQHRDAVACIKQLANVSRSKHVEARDQHGPTCHSDAIH
ncbi:CAMK protein kinase, variant [Aphanomyces astaci]|uniref:non-specific serine/threonine protein kinase n=1 Tax=Aphanomyces astaci TaxID=112090 RepID=W4GUN0_APHAT|nr:CAMK protein kinase, variant [Aphanomyces astaci]ETV82724.1 CAMK protein kinase, variant [Aphanomyces astaci]|eukprot:XP_009827395.1 CAMK protein kinase, variant [Aphanomyces astaci]